MLRSLHNAASGMKAQQQKMDVTANNIANVNTTGFKKKKAEFSDLVYQSVERKGNAVVPSPPGASPAVVGAGGRVAAIRSDTRPGTYFETGGKLDFAIVGDGYFRVLLPGGREAYTRDGSFRLDGEGNLVTATGFRVVFPELPQGDFDLQVSPDGVVSVLSGEEEVVSGRLGLARFNNPEGLEQLGDNLLAATALSGEAEIIAPGQETKVMQGYLESSNVELGEEMVKLIISQRAFELNARALRTADEMWGIANQMRR